MTSKCSAYRAAVRVTMTILLCSLSEVSCKRREESHKFTIDELLSTSFAHKDSNDLGMDPCKAGKYSLDLRILYQCKMVK